MSRTEARKYIPQNMLRITVKTDKPSPEVAPTTFAQGTRGVKNGEKITATSRRLHEWTVLQAPAKGAGHHKMFPPVSFCQPVTVNFDALPIRTGPTQGQIQSTCHTSKVISFKSYTPTHPHTHTHTVDCGPIALYGH